MRPCPYICRLTYLEPLPPRFSDDVSPLWHQLVLDHLLQLRQHLARHHGLGRKGTHGHTTNSQCILLPFELQHKGGRKMTWHQMVWKPILCRITGSLKAQRRMEMLGWVRRMLPPAGHLSAMFAHLHIVFVDVHLYGARSRSWDLGNALSLHVRKEANENQMAFATTSPGSICVSQNVCLECSLCKGKQIQKGW